MNDATVLPDQSTSSRPTKQTRPDSSPQGGASQPQKADGRPRIHIQQTPKGGAGKTFTMSVLAQFLQHIGRPVKAYDTDPLNATLTSFQALNAERVKLVDRGRIIIEAADAFVETLLASKTDVVIDNGASSFSPVSSYLIENGIVGILEEAKRELVVHSIIVGGGDFLDTMKGLDYVASHYPPSVKIVVWLNEFFGRVEANGTPFEETRLYEDVKDRISGIVRLAELNEQTFGANLKAMLAQRLTFEEALSGTRFNTVERSRLRTIQRDLFAQIAQVI